MALKNKAFNTDELTVCSWQYEVRHRHPSCFSFGEVVFLKSNPEVPLIVESLGPIKVTVKWCDKKGVDQYLEFMPQCLLQYAYAGLVTYKETTKICLN